MADIAIVLPPREAFSPGAAGAIALVVRRFCVALPGAVVLGRDAGPTFPGIAYQRAGNAFQLWAILRRRSPAVIEVHQQPRLALALAVLFPRARVLLCLHNDPLTMRGLRSRFGRNLALHLLHRVVCVSSYLAKRYATGLKRGPDVLPNPLAEEELPMPAPKTPCILFAGRIVVNKAPDIFIAACAAALPQLPGWSAVLIGGDRFGPDSPETAYVQAQRAAAQAAGVAFLGYRPHAEVMAAMNEAAIVVVPSRWNEPFGLTALEALATGAALITTGLGGLREVAGEAALLIPPDDAPALTQALLDLARDEPRRGALAAAGRTRACEFLTPAIAPRLQALRDAT